MCKENGFTIGEGLAGRDFGEVRGVVAGAGREQNGQCQDREEESFSSIKLLYNNILLSVIACELESIA